MNTLIANKDYLLNTLESNIKQIISKSNLSNIDDLLKERELKQQELLMLNKLIKKKQATSEQREQATKLMETITTINQNIERLESQKEKVNLNELRLKQIKKYLNKTFNEFDGTVFKSLVAKIIAITNKRIRFVFKCDGIQIEQDL